MCILWDPSAPNNVNQNSGLGTIDNNHARPSSNHPNGAVITFCDTSVKFVNQSISYQVYAALMTSWGLAAQAPGAAFTNGNGYQTYQNITLDASMIPTN